MPEGTARVVEGLRGESEMVRVGALIFLLLPASVGAFPSCADKIDAGAVVSCPDSWLGIARWVGYRASEGTLPGVYAASGTALGRAVAAWVDAKGALQVYEGPAFDRSRGSTTIRWKGGAAEPETVWAFAISVAPNGSLDAIAVMASASAPMIAAAHITTIDAIEAATGLDFLAELPDGQEGPLEAGRASAFWGAAAAPPPEPPPPPPPPAKPPLPEPVVTPKLETQKPVDMSESQWAAHRSWVEGQRLMKDGDMSGAREAFTKCFETDEKRSDCSSAIMRTFGARG